VIALAVAFSRLVLRRMMAPPAITLIMITLGLGAVMRGVGAVAFAGVPSAISLPIPADPIMIGGVPIATDKLVAAIIALVSGVVSLAAIRGRDFAQQQRPS